MTLTAISGLSEDVPLGAVPGLVLDYARSSRYLISAAFLLYFVYLEKSRFSWMASRSDIPTLIAAIFFSIATLVSVVLSSTGSTFIIRRSVVHLLLWGVLFILITAFLFSLLKPMFYYMQGKEKSILSFGVPSIQLMTICFFLFCFCWFPYIVAFAPGSTCPNIAWQLQQTTGGSEFSAHHPVVSTLVYGIPFSFGSTISGSDSGGLFAVVIFQTVCLALACSYEVMTIGRMQKSQRVTAASAAFFAVLPVFGMYCQWCVKDSLFGCVFAIYSTQIVLFSLYTRRMMQSKQNIAILLLSAVLVGLLRNNGFYIVLLSLPVVLVCMRRARCASRALLAIVIVAILAIPSVAMAVKFMVNASDGSPREALSIPFQQTARYALLHSDDVAEWEKKAIDDVLDYGTLPDRYNPYVSDPVKDDSYNKDGSVADYFRAWLSQGARHPFTYIDATLIQTYGYWSLEPPTYPAEFAGTICRYDGDNHGFEWDSWAPLWLRQSFDEFLHVVRAVPIVGLFLAPGVYVWLLILEVCYLQWRGRGWLTLALMPCLVLVLTSVAGPLNGAVRYCFGLICATPLTFVASCLVTPKSIMDE